MSVHSPSQDNTHPLVDRGALALLAVVAAAAILTHRDYVGLQDDLPPSLAMLSDLFSQPALGATMGLLCLGLTWRIARNVAGSFGGLIALALLATTPLYYGTMFVSPRDIGFAAAMSLLLLGLVRIIRTWPALGIASVALFALGVAVTVATWPSPSEPIEALFRGQVVDLSDPPATYVLVLLWLKLPEIFLVLIFAGLALAILGAVRAGKPLQQRVMLALIALWAVAPLMISMIIRPAVDGIGQYLFVLPPLAVTGGIAAGWIATRIARDDRRMRAVAAAALMLGLLPPVTAMARAHPYQYAAFNELAGGARGMRPFYTLDGYGLSLREAARTLTTDLASRGETPPAGRSWQVAICGPQEPAQSALDSRFEVTAKPQGADFALMLGEFYCSGLDAPQIAPVERDNAIFARVYDLRGRRIEKLFTRPMPNR